MLIRKKKISNQQPKFTIQGAIKRRTNQTQSQQKEGNNKDYSGDKCNGEYKNNRKKSTKLRADSLKVQQN